MQYNALLLLASLVGSTLTAPTPHNAENLAVINTRFLKYENKPRDAAAAEEKNALINSRFITYENKPRDASAAGEKNALINSRFLTYENKPRDAT
ncbi:MAG: hypothetical protein Q9207_005888 [Kuettlingeria erythrocarpa]